ncbi:unnamed protein product, partial [Polarella glacialis]
APPLASSPLASSPSPESDQPAAKVEPPKPGVLKSQQKLCRPRGSVLCADAGGGRSPEPEPKPSAPKGTGSRRNGPRSKPFAQGRPFASSDSSPACEKLSQLLERAMGASNVSHQERPGVWERAVDKERNAVYYWDHRLQVATWSVPPPVLGWWERIWDPIQNLEFFWNSATAETLWHLPLPGGCNGPPSWSDPPSFGAMGMGATTLFASPVPGNVEKVTVPTPTPPSAPPLSMSSPSTAPPSAAPVLTPTSPTIAPLPNQQQQQQQHQQQQQQQQQQAASIAPPFMTPPSTAPPSTTPVSADPLLGVAREFPLGMTVSNVLQHPVLRGSMSKAGPPERLVFQPQEPIPKFPPPPPKQRPPGHSTPTQKVEMSAMPGPTRMPAPPKAPPPAHLQEEMRERAPLPRPGSVWNEEGCGESPEDPTGWGSSPDGGEDEGEDAESNDERQDWMDDEQGPCQTGCDEGTWVPPDEDARSTWDEDDKSTGD